VKTTVMTLTLDTGIMSTFWRIYTCNIAVLLLTRQV